jgi:predicted nucleotidyltransferase
MTDRFDFQSVVSDERQVAICERLSWIESEEGVRVLFAVESGSRAWGFPSPDSDYDVRFVYLRPVRSYLRLTPQPDVIELPIADDLDIAGWDLRKALALLVKPNAVLLEWLSSPIRYRWQPDIGAALIDLARRTLHVPACRHHYLRLAARQWDEHIAERTEVGRKKYFYVLRPALALRWLRLKPEAPPPMALSDLCAGAALPAHVASAIDLLVRQKREVRELGLGPRLAVLDELIEAEIVFAQTQLDPSVVDPVVLADAEALFAELALAQVRPVLSRHEWVVAAGRVDGEVQA